jgi:hypothetical protein
MRRLSNFLILFLVQAGIACATEPHDDLFAVSGAVAGSVLTRAQAPVAGATVTASAQYPLPRGNLVIVATALTDTAGRFRVLLISGNLPDTIASLVLHVTATGYAPRDTAGLQLRIARNLSPSDTTRVVMTIAP